MDSRCLQIRKDILWITKVSKHGHLPSAYSIVETLVSVYDNIRHNPKNPNDDDRDYFLLSKGHACLALYCTLARLGYYDIKEIEGYGGYGCRFGCHPDRTKLPGIEASTGSLGHGIGIAAGIALGLKIRKKSNRVICLIGDGEANEGTVWETMMASANVGLDNFTVIYDNNGSQERCLLIENPGEKFKSFGAHVTELNGHNMDELNAALKTKTNKPHVIIANTRKGWGSKTLVENKFEWHRRSPNDSEFEMIVKELENA